MGFPIGSSQRPRGRNWSLETLFHFGLDWTSAKCLGLHLRSIADLLGQGTQNQEDCSFIAVQEELCNPTGIEGWNLVVSEHLLTTFEMSPTAL